MDGQWWQRLAGAGAAGANGAMQQPASPWGGLAQAAGKFGGALRDRLNQNKNTETSKPTGGLPTDGSPGDYGGEYGEPMAAGKVVTKPTLALIGEDQPEAVVPLGYRQQAKVRPSMAMPRTGRNYYQ